MESWTNICNFITKYARTDCEMTYQQSVVDLLLENKLGWNRSQIQEQPALQIGSTKRIIPDVVISKNHIDRFIIEFKEPAHIRTPQDIDQLVSYMKQMEIPVGIYIGGHIDVYYKNFGDCSDAKLVLSTSFNPQDKNGDTFISMFAEDHYSIELVRHYVQEQDTKQRFELNVGRLVSQILSPEFQHELKEILITHFQNESNDVIEAALESVSISITSAKEAKHARATIPEVCCAPDSHHISKKRAHKGEAQRHAYNLIKQIVEKNNTLGFQEVHNIFGRKNYIEDISKIKDESRWFMAKEDILTLTDGTNIVISNQWGFNGTCKRKMERLHNIAKSFHIEIR